MGETLSTSLCSVGEITTREALIKSIAGRSVVLVDDSLRERQLWGHLFPLLGCTNYVIYGCTEDALGYLQSRTVENLPDTLITGVNMEGKPLGLDLIRVVQGEYGGSIQIVAMSDGFSGDPGERLVQQVQALGVPFIKKVNISALIFGDGDKD